MYVCNMYKKIYTEHSSQSVYNVGACACQVVKYHYESIIIFLNFVGPL